MTGTELLQLAVCLLFPLGLLALFMWNVGIHHGHTPRQILAHLAVVGISLVGVVAVGWWLSVSRGGPVVSYEAGAVGFGAVRLTDVVGLAICVALLAVVLWTVRRLSRVNPASRSEARPHD
jgi:hypothetical protein